MHIWTSQVALAVKNMLVNAGDPRGMGSIPASGRSPGEGTGNLLQYSCLENPMSRRTQWAIVHRVTKSQTWLSHTRKSLPVTCQRLCSHIRNFSFLSCLWTVLSITDSSHFYRFPHKCPQNISLPLSLLFLQQLYCSPSLITI